MKELIAEIEETWAEMNRLFLATGFIVAGKIAWELKNESANGFGAVNQEYRFEWAQAMVISFFVGGIKGWQGQGNDSYSDRVSQIGLRYGNLEKQCSREIHLSLEKIRAFEEKMNKDEYRQLTEMLKVPKSGFVLAQEEAYKKQNKPMFQIVVDK